MWLIGLCSHFVIVSVFHWVFRLVSSFEITTFCSPFLEYCLQTQPQVAGYFHLSLLLQASEWKWPDRAAGRHLRLVVSTEFPVRACGKKACSCLLGSVLWSNCIFFGREKRKGGNCPRSRCLFNQYYPLMTIFASWWCTLRKLGWSQSSAGCALIRLLCESWPFLHRAPIYRAVVISLNCESKCSHLFDIFLQATRGIGTRQ